MRDEDREQAVLGADVLDEGRARGGQIGHSARGTGPDAESPGLYGKMLRRASRIRPSPPMAGADS